MILLFQPGSHNLLSAIYISYIYHMYIYIYHIYIICIYIYIIYIYISIPGALQIHQHTKPNNAITTIPLCRITTVSPLYHPRDSPCGMPIFDILSQHRGATLSITFQLYSMNISSISTMFSDFHIFSKIFEEVP